MYWQAPHINKVYEALSVIADNRLTLVSPTEAHVFSTSGNKYYTVTFDPVTGAMMSDDNSAYWTDSLSYPMIAFLLITGRLGYDSKYLSYLANIRWKDINQQFKNDFDKSTEYVLSQIDQRVVPELKNEATRIYELVCKLKIERLGPKKKPSAAY